MHSITLDIKQLIPPPSLPNLENNLSKEPLSGPSTDFHKIVLEQNITWGKKIAKFLFELSALTNSDEKEDSMTSVNLDLLINKLIHSLFMHSVLIFILPYMNLFQFYKEIKGYEKESTKYIETITKSIFIAKSENLFYEFEGLLNDIILLLKKNLIKTSTKNESGDLFISEAVSLHLEKHLAAIIGGLLQLKHTSNNAIKHSTTIDNLIKRNKIDVSIETLVHILNALTTDNNINQKKCIKQDSMGISQLMIKDVSIKLSLLIVSNTDSLRQTIIYFVENVIDCEHTANKTQLTESVCELILSVPEGQTSNKYYKLIISQILTYLGQYSNENIDANKYSYNNTEYEVGKMLVLVFAKMILKTQPKYQIYVGNFVMYPFRLWKKINYKTKGFANRESKQDMLLSLESEIPSKNYHLNSTIVDSKELNKRINVLCNICSMLNDSLLFELVNNVMLLPNFVSLYYLYQRSYFNIDLKNKLFKVMKKSFMKLDLNQKTNVVEEILFHTKQEEFSAEYSFSVDICGLATLNVCQNSKENELDMLVLIAFLKDAAADFKDFFVAIVCHLFETCLFSNNHAQNNKVVALEFVSLLFENDVDVVGKDSMKLMVVCNKIMEQILRCETLKSDKLIEPLFFDSTCSSDENNELILLVVGLLNICFNNVLFDKDPTKVHIQQSLLDKLEQNLASAESHFCKTFSGTEIHDLKLKISTYRYSRTKQPNVNQPSTKHSILNNFKPKLTTVLQLSQDDLIPNQAMSIKILDTLLGSAKQILSSAHKTEFESIFEAVTDKLIRSADSYVYLAAIQAIGKYCLLYKDTYVESVLSKYSSDRSDFETRLKYGEVLVYLLIYKNIYLMNITTAKTVLDTLIHMLKPRASKSIENSYLLRRSSMALLSIYCEHNILLLLEYTDYIVDFVKHVMVLDKKSVNHNHDGDLKREALFVVFSILNAYENHGTGFNEVPLLTRSALVKIRECFLIGSNSCFTDKIMLHYSQKGLEKLDELMEALVIEEI